MRLKIICIVGVGHSGSTLLGNSLDGNDAVCLGEIKQFPEGLVDVPHECSCGLSVRDCAYWNAISREWHRRVPGLDLAEHSRVAHDVGQRAVVALKANAALPYDDDIRRSCCDVDALFDAAASVSGAKTLIDCSKHVGRAALLARHSTHEICILHLIRDPRGVAWSHRKARPPKPGQSENEPRSRSVRKTIHRWNRDNGIASRLVTTTSRPAVSLRYEDFVTKTDSSLARLEAELALDLSSARAAVQARQPLISDHAVAGNTGVRRRPVTELVLDEKWRQGLSVLERLYCGIVVSRGLKWHFGY